MMASSVPTLTVSPSWTLIWTILPATGEGTSVSTLSVEISNSGSSRSMVSPSFFSHLVMVPSTTVSPSCGMVTGVGTSDPPSRSHRVQRLAGQGQERLADPLGQRGVRVDQPGHVGRPGFPVVHERGLGDELGDVGPDHVHAEHRPFLLRHHLHDPALAHDVRL